MYRDGIVQKYLKEELLAEFERDYEKYNSKKKLTRTTDDQPTLLNEEENKRLIKTDLIRIIPFVSFKTLTCYKLFVYLTGNRKISGVRFTDIIYDVFEQLDPEEKKRMKCIPASVEENEALISSEMVRNGHVMINIF